MIKKQKRFNGIKFIEVTHKILQQNEFKDIIKWDDQGKNIIIIDKLLLQQIVLPKYFKHAKYSSFLRQLNFYGFTSSKDENSYLTYYHQYFTKDKYEENNIQKKKLLIKDVQKSLGIFQFVQNELQSQLLTLQMDQNRIKQTLLNSIDQQLLLRSKIKEFLQSIRFMRLQGEDNFDQFIRGIQTILQGLNPMAQHHFQHLINLVFKQFFNDDIVSNQYQSEIDEQSNSYMLSPCPFGLLELRTNLNVQKDLNLKNLELSMDS
ncbi:unnamed protein product [Paramecium sonneborni]|uniref:HSF-type DNA-binding domain-containing protein n=1 Tax=Paramecium sonneborni TaxID=65129 RepID=A0A8S1MUE0_9CILI|nr:unnamed protein product [Paramecium sonneborni]